MALNDDIQRLLGVVPPPPRPAPLAPGAVAPDSSVYAHAVEDRPAEKYWFTINVYRTEYGSARVAATDKYDATSEMCYEDIDWYDSGDYDTGDVESDGDDEIANQDELDAWDQQYGTKYRSDGLPMCSECNVVMHPKDLTETPDHTAWYCADCNESPF